MKLNFLFLFLFFGLIQFTSCEKENIDTTTTEEENNDPEITVVNCTTLSISLLENANPPNPPTVTATVTGGTPPYAYSWSNGAATNPITVSTSGNYGLTVTDASGCVTESDIDVVVTDPCSSLDATIVPELSGSSIALTAVVVGGTLPYAYAWSTGENTSSITVNTSGNYGLTVTDANGCMLDLSMDIEVTNSCASLDATITPEPLGGGPIALTAVVVGGTLPYAYAWSTGEHTSAITVNASGNYGLTVTDANGCILELNTDVEVTNLCSSLSAAIMADVGNPALLTAVVTGGNSPYAYNWSTGETSNVITAPVSGSYSLTVTDANGCMVDVNIDVEVTNLCSSLDVSITVFTGTEVILTANATGGAPAYAYTWSNGETTSAISVPLNSGSYTVIVTDSNGCMHEETIDL